MKNVCFDNNINCDSFKKVSSDNIALIEYNYIKYIKAQLVLIS